MASNALVTLRDVFATKGAMTAHELAPAHVDSMTAERFKAGLLVCLRNDNSGKLAQCSPASIAESLRMAALVGLVPGEGKCYLIPYGGQCTLSVGVWGIVELMRRSGQVADVNTGVVHEGDGYRVIFEGPERGVYHEQASFGDRGPVVGYYATVRLKDADAPLIETMSVEDVERVRQSSSKAPNSPAWKNYFDEMGRKVVLRRLSKRVPMEPDDLRRLSEVEASEWDMERPAKQRPTIEMPKALKPRAPEPLEISEDDIPEFADQPEAEPDDAELDRQFAEQEKVGKR